MPRRLLLTGLCTFAGFLCPTVASAASLNLTYHYQHYLFTITTAQEKNWNKPQEMWTYDGQPVIPPQELRVDGDDVPPLPAGFEKHTIVALDRTAIMQTIAGVIASQLDRDAGAVTIGRTATGAIEFDGVGLPGRSVDVAAAANLTINALNTNTANVMLPVSETPPQVTVTDPGLSAQGIKEVVTVGESDFSNSPNNRLHNIAVGLSKFNGFLIPQGSVFSFDKVLGRVDNTTGYLKELVIKGDQTVPDYGGGLCQVSTTAYRGVWEYGFPIVKRINHSYMVSHYAPQGTDATVYPPNVDMQFKNDSSGALLMQTYEADHKAYFIYYGTKDDRQSQVVGPFVWDQTPVPPEKTELTLDLPPGQKKKVGDPVPGEDAAWFRTVTESGSTKTQGFYSIYEARPLYYLVGTDKLPTATGSTATTPPTTFLND